MWLCTEGTGMCLIGFRGEVCVPCVLNDQKKGVNS